MRRVHWGFLAICLIGIGGGQVLAAGVVEPSITKAAETSVIDRTDPKVIRRIPPAYPESAINRMIEGWVELEFFVEQDGQITNVEPIRAIPSGIFEKAILKAIAQWKYQPGTFNGTPIRQSQNIIMTLQMADSTPSQKFLDLYKSVSSHIKGSNLKVAQKKLSDMEKKHTKSLRERELVNGLYAEYHIAQNNNLRAIHRLREANRFASHGKNKEEKNERLFALFGLEMTEGHHAAALRTYSSMIRGKVELSPDTRYEASEIRASIRSRSQLAANGLLRESCHKCRRGVSMWSHRLSYNSFRLADIDGKVTTLKLACDYHWETYSKLPQTSITVPSEWGECQVRVKGKTGTTFTLVEN